VNLLGKCPTVSPYHTTGNCER